MEIGWEIQVTQGQVRLRDNNGDIWQPIPQYGLGLLKNMLEEARETLLWQRAALHRHEGGMERGVDMTLVSKHYN
eukprot:6662537-Karenia_brevis.AAC.1